MTHHLKIHPEYYKSLLNGSKTCEIRFNDRDYQVGDLIEFSHDENPEWEITHVLKFPEGLRDGYVALSIRKI